MSLEKATDGRNNATALNAFDMLSKEDRTQEREETRMLVT